MTILKFPSQKQQPEDSPFFNEIVENGYHIFSLKNAKIPDYYPNEFPDYPGVNVNDLKPDDLITVRVFFRVGNGHAEGGYLDLKVKHIKGSDSVRVVILTQLPKEFPLGTGDSIDVYEE